MLRKVESKKMIAMLFAIVYLFVALFSQNFHDHGSGEVLKDFHFSQKEKTFKSSQVYNYSNCLSCHVLHDGKHLNFKPFEFSTYSFHVNVDKTFSPKSKSFASTITHFFLRGPPHYFI